MNGDYFHMTERRWQKLLSLLWDVTEKEVKDIALDTKWSEPEHQKWLDTAPLYKIADWVDGIMVAKNNERIMQYR